MADNAGDLGGATSPNFAVQALHQVNAASEHFPSPTLVTDAVLPEDLASKWRESVRRVTDETSDSMRVHSYDERDKEVVGVPERLERLLADPVVSSRVHEQHAEEHDMASDTTGLGVVDLDRKHRSNLRPLDVEKAVVVSRRTELAVTGDRRLT